MDPLTLAMFAILAVLVFFTWRSSRKRKQAEEEKKQGLQPGVEVMTNFGVYGTLIDIDIEANQATIESTPGTSFRVHPAAIAKVITEDEKDGPRSVEEAMALANAEQAEREAAEAGVDAPVETDVVAEPEFGERTTEPTKRAPRAKKSAE